jgi:hypothetical protein
VVGHSLGAGTACLLGLLLRPAYPGLRVFGYGMPGSVVDPITAEEMRSYVTTVVLGDDLIARLSFSGTIRLRNKVLDCIARAKVSKLKVFSAALASDDSDAADPRLLMHPKDQVPDTPFSRSLESFRARSGTMAEMIEGREVLVLPGRIVHLERQHRGFLGGFKGIRRTLWKVLTNKKTHYDAYEGDTDFFREIDVSPSMAWEHFPDQYHIHCNALWARWENVYNDDQARRSLEAARVINASRVNERVSLNQSFTASANPPDIRVGGTSISEGTGLDGGDSKGPMGSSRGTYHAI